MRPLVLEVSSPRGDAVGKSPLGNWLRGNWLRGKSLRGEKPTVPQGDPRGENYFFSSVVFCLTYRSEAVL